MSIPITGKNQGPPSQASIVPVDNGAGLLAPYDPSFIIDAGGIFDPDINKSEGMPFIPPVLTPEKSNGQFLDKELGDFKGSPIYAIINAWTVARSLWKEGEADTEAEKNGNRPLCYSRDGITGSNKEYCETGKCADCNLSKWNSGHILTGGEPKEGPPACTELRKAVFYLIDDEVCGRIRRWLIEIKRENHRVQARKVELIMDDIVHQVPFQISLPPTSLRKFSEFIRTVSRLKAPYTMVIVKMGIEVLKGNKFSYCKVDHKFVCNITPLVITFPEISRKFQEQHDAAKTYLAGAEVTAADYPTDTNGGDSKDAAAKEESPGAPPPRPGEKEVSGIPGNEPGPLEAEAEVEAEAGEVILIDGDDPNQPSL